MTLLNARYVELELILCRYLSTLEERLAVVEKRLNDIGNSSNEGSIIPGLSVPIARFEDESVSSQTNGIQSLTDEAVEDETDGMGAMVFTEEDDSAFFGLLHVSLHVI